MVDSCGCDLYRRNILYIGKAVSLRNRLQAELFPTLYRSSPEWMDTYTMDPHDHILFAAVWFVPKPLIGLAEAVLIEALNPRHNNRRKIGFSDPSLWPFRWPDVEAISAPDIEPVKPRAYKRGDRIDCPLNRRSGVYAWYYGDLRPLEASCSSSPLDQFLSGHQTTF